MINHIWTTHGIIQCVIIVLFLICFCKYMLSHFEYTNIVVFSVLFNFILHVKNAKHADFLTGKRREEKWQTCISKLKNVQTCQKCETCRTFDGKTSGGKCQTHISKMKNVLTCQKCQTWRSFLTLKTPGGKMPNAYFKN